MNKTMQTILNHRSVRSFKDILLTTRQIKDLVESAQAASSASFQQAYSIIGVSDRSLKEKIRACAGGQEFIVKNGHFFVFCADLYRHKVIADNMGTDLSDTIEGIDAVMVGALDASFAAQNMAIAAESMGMGICYVGGVRDGAVDISNCLGIPNHVLPVFGFAVGYPAEMNEQKPRFPFEIIYHENYYNNDRNKLNDQLVKYDTVMANYYLQRSQNKKQSTWTKETLKKSQRHPRLFMRDFISQKGWAKH